MVLGSSVDIVLSDFPDPSEELMDHTSSLLQYRRVIHDFHLTIVSYRAHSAFLELLVTEKSALYVFANMKHLREAMGCDLVH